MIDLTRSKLDPKFVRLVWDVIGYKEPDKTQAWVDRTLFVLGIDRARIAVLRKYDMLPNKDAE